MSVSHELAPAHTNVINCRVQRYQKCFYELQDIFITDLLFFVHHTKYSTNDQEEIIVSSQTIPQCHLDTCELVELLQQSAVEHLTAFRHVEAQKFSSVVEIVTTDFEALYAYKCGDYQRCLQCLHMLYTR